MKMRKTCAALSVVLTVAVTLPFVSDGVSADAAKKPALKPKKISVEVGKSKKITVKNYKKKVTWKADKPKIVKLSAKKKTSVKVTGKKKGTAKVTATYKQGGKNKKLVCKVTVKDAAVAPTPQTNTQQSPQPQPQQPTNAPVPTEDPNATPQPTPTFDYDAYEDCLWKQPGDHIKDVFSKYFKVGVSTGLGDLRFGECAALIRYHFASITMGNETKLESMITDEVSKKNVDNYYATNGDGHVVIDFENLEKILSYCKEKGIKMRYHAFVWHSQVQPYFFLQDYNWQDYELSEYEEKNWDTSNYHKLADKETMKKRLNDYISQVIEYIYSHGYGDVVYAYDVINEANNGGISCYVNENATSADEALASSGDNSNMFKTNPGVTTGGAGGGGKSVTADSSPEEVEDMFYSEGRVPDGSHSYWYATMGTDYLYLSFLYAHNAVEKYYEQYKGQFGYTEKPSLIYNDYNQKEGEHINLAKYINLACNLENGTSGVKYCNGIGLQSHSVAESTQERMIKAIADAGLEVQITELDEGLTGDSQASKLKKQYQIYMNYSKNGDYGKQQGDDYIGVTSVTNWGLRDGDGGGWDANYIFEPYDDGLEEHILEYAPKPAYFAILQAGGVDCGDKVY